MFQKELSTTWKFKATDSTNWLAAEVPGVVHTDLLAHNLIPHPFIGTNEVDVQWIEEKQWEYRTTFNISDAEREYTNVDLVFEGLDTYAEIFLNGHSVLKPNNMFRKWRIGARKVLSKGDNELRVVFTPPIEKNKLKLKELNYTLPAGSETGR